MVSSLASALARPHRALAELGALAGLYVLYELLRGTGEADVVLARANTADIVSLERALGVFHERAVQEWVQGLPLLPVLLAASYMTLHAAVTAGVVRWVYRKRPEAFPLLRTTLVIGTAMSLLIYVVYPAAPPRLANLGFADTVSSGVHLNLSSDLLGSFYNPLAAVPSLHFGYALVSGVALAVLAERRWVRALGAIYPVFMLFDIVATGNHFLFDAVAGGAVVVAGWWIARRLLRAARIRTALSDQHGLTAEQPAPGHV
jgi:hypothetical protein